MLKFVSRFTLGLLALTIASESFGVTYVPQSDDPHECKRTQLNDRDCGRWFSLEEVVNNPRDRYNRPGVVRRPKRWYRVGQPKAPEPKTIVLNGVNFDTAKASLKADAIPILQSNVAELKSFGNVSIKVVGHTDAQGSDSYNQDLSDRRANTVKNYFIEQGISPNRISSAGAGESQPVATNDTPEGRYQNRRIEIHIQ